jgi:hypothetical protein
MLRELARPVALVFCILSLYAVFQAAFFEPASDVSYRFRESLAMLGLAGTVCLLSGWVFRDAKHSSHRGLAKTLPVQLFCWGSTGMAVLFLMAWYLETYSVFETHARY